MEDSINYLSGSSVTFLVTYLIAAMVLYALTEGLVLVWTAWSIRKHGWCRRSVRRFSYLIFALLLAVRLAWFSALLLSCRDHPDAGSLALRSTAAVSLSRGAFCLHFLAFSMLVCGWADSTYMMMAGRSLQVQAIDARPRSHRAHLRRATPCLQLTLCESHWPALTFACTRHSPLTLDCTTLAYTHHSPLTTHHLPLATHHSPLTPARTTCHSLLQLRQPSPVRATMLFYHMTSLFVALNSVSK